MAHQLMFRLLFQRCVTFAPAAGDDQVEIREQSLPPASSLLEKGVNEGLFDVFGTSCSEYLLYMACTHNIQTHNMWPCCLCHILYMQSELTSPITSSLFSPHTLCLTPKSCSENILMSSHVKCTWFSPWEFLLSMFLDAEEDTGWPP